MHKINWQAKPMRPLLEHAVQRLAAAGIELQITKKRVKNINFRLKPYQLKVSVPLFISDNQLAQSIDKRIGWAITHHPQVLAQHQYQQEQYKQTPANQSVMLWGQAQDFTLESDNKIAYYREQLSMVMPELFAKWQPIVGAYANETRIKKMHTRWGTCNTRARRVWLSAYLPAYPIECTEYVIVHELCHMHHANHSRAFWQTVATAMPNYRQWHDKLAGRSRRVD